MFGAQDWWLAKWNGGGGTDAMAGGMGGAIAVYVGMFAMTSTVSSSTYSLTHSLTHSSSTRFPLPPLLLQTTRYVGVFAAGAAVTLVRSLQWATFTVDTGSAVHDRALAALLRAPMRWFDGTPFGRILNRFSADQADLDERLPAVFEMALQVLTFLLTWALLTSAFSVFFLQLYSRLTPYSFPSHFFT